jgi:hypothetical protein
MAIEGLAVEWLAGLGRQLELGKLSQDGQGLRLDTAGQKRKQEGYAALRVAFCEASMPQASSKAKPKAAVTVRLSTGPGYAFGRWSV